MYSYNLDSNSIDRKPSIQYSLDIQKIERALQISELAFQELLNNLQNPVAIYEPWNDGEDFVFKNINPAAELVDKVARSDIIGKKITEVFPGVKEFGLFDVFQRVWKSGQSESFPLHFYQDGRISRWRENHLYRCPSGTLVAIYEDLTEQKKTEEALRLAAVTFETSDAILITDANAIIQRVNKAFEEITGYRAEEVIGKNPRVMSSGRHDKIFYHELWQQIYSTGSWSGEIWDKRKNGQIYPKWLTITAIKDIKGETTHYVGIFNDITERKLVEDRMHYMAYFDALTNIPNRRLLHDRINLAISLSSRTKLFGAVLLLDMDKFKVLNDTWGHEYGDLLLIEVAARIQSCLRVVDTVARLGGDEFVILIEEISEKKDQALQKVSTITEKIRKELTRAYRIKDQEYYCSPSIGVCIFSGSDKSVVDLLKAADMAMYHAKDAGRNTIRFFDPQMQQEVDYRSELESNLRRAIQEGNLELHYQIQVDVKGNALGAEALLRWNDPGLGSISPSQFIPIAEQSPLILDIGNWVIESASRQLSIWSHDESKRDLTLSVNISARQFSINNFVDKLNGIIHSNHIDPSHLKLELNEHIMENDIAEVIDKMQALKSLGIQLSIDDFGSGYSSLYFLKKLPIQQLKIDQNFVRDLVHEEHGAILIKTIMGMAQNFHLNVIAEGVETREQLEILRDNGCKSYQGYMFGRPVPVGEFEDLFNRGLVHQQPV